MIVWEALQVRERHSFIVRQHVHHEVFVWDCQWLCWCTLQIKHCVLEGGIRLSWGWALKATQLGINPLTPAQLELVRQASQTNGISNLKFVHSDCWQQLALLQRKVLPLMKYWLSSRVKMVLIGFYFLGTEGWALEATHCRPHCLSPSLSPCMSIESFACKINGWAFGAAISLGGEGQKTLTVGPCFQVFSTIHGPSTFVTIPQRLYNHYNHAHAPGQRMWPSPAPRPCSKCSKAVEVGCSY